MGRERYDMHNWNQSVDVAVIQHIYVLTSRLSWHPLTSALMALDDCGSNFGLDAIR